MSRFAAPQDPVFQALNSSVAFDRRLAPYDLRQSRAHARMLARCEIIADEDAAELVRGLDAVQAEVDADTFEIHPGDEDIHMAIERRLTELVGPVGGKLHTGRSRNDQVATDMRIWLLGEVKTIEESLKALLRVMVERADKEIDILMPGYTHLQVRAFV